MNKQKKGLIIILSESILWSLFPIFAISSYSQIPPLLSAACTTLFAAVLFALILTFQKRWNQFRNITVWKEIFLSTIIIGIGFYLLVFIGMSKTTAGNSSIIFILEIVFSFLFLKIFKKENSSFINFLGAIFMIIGAIIILFPGKIEFNIGDIILLIAVMIPPLGNYYQQQARKQISSIHILFIRSIASSLFFFFIVFITHDNISITAIKNSILLLLLNGILIMGFSKILWIEAIHRIPISKAVSFSTITPLITLIVSHFYLHEIPTIWQISAFIPIMYGGILVMRK